MTFITVNLHNSGFCTTHVMLAILNRTLNKPTSSWPAIKAVWQERFYGSLFHEWQNNKQLSHCNRLTPFAYVSSIPNNLWACESSTCTPMWLQYLVGDSRGSVGRRGRSAGLHCSVTCARAQSWWRPSAACPSHSPSADASGPSRDRILQGLHREWTNVSHTERDAPKLFRVPSDILNWNKFFPKI